MGAGAIGLELGDFFGMMGSKITIVEAAPHIAPTEDADIAKEMDRVQSKAGRTCISGVMAKSLVTKGRQAELTLGDGRVLTASKALVAVGRTPNTAGLDCEKAGCTLKRRGFVDVNDHLEAAEGVYETQIAWLPWLPVAIGITILALAVSCIRYGASERR